MTQQTDTDDTALASVFDAVHASVAWLNAHNGHRGYDAELAGRILKVTEEAGEAAAAWIGLTGQNPRKGFTHTIDDVTAELADVVMAALVAIASLGADPVAVLANNASTVQSRVLDDTCAVTAGVIDGIDTRSNERIDDAPRDPERQEDDQ